MADEQGNDGKKNRTGKRRRRRATVRLGGLSQSTFAGSAMSAEVQKSAKRPKKPTPDSSDETLLGGDNDSKGASKDEV